jgi:hypothetical protein
VKKKKKINTNAPHPTISEKNTNKIIVPGIKEIKKRTASNEKELCSNSLKFKALFPLSAGGNSVPLAYYVSIQRTF